MDAIQELECAIAKAQGALQALKAQKTVTAEGWSAVRHSGTEPLPTQQERFAKRHGCTWNDKEQRDLVGGFLRLETHQELARTHRRTEGAIRSELGRLLHAANHDVLLGEICG